ncbi:MAG: tRNA pseudouridine(38-40) synthase TruA [Myxococcaceae bacterium]|nr:tRNA pseudouridine(38-40) synthase TruA [Myxococcaceae bacterium]MCI0670531.1 tRNA pseudouridine(38-40) synthase TruA [Myxococcaceae bacterium]
MALWLWYRGDAFRGFQVQTEGPTVQGALEAGLAALGHEVRPVPSGRTDRGVHARMQVVSLRLPAHEEVESLPGRLRPHLPAELGVVSAHVPPRGFHAQWTAVEKEYRYRLCPGAVPEEWRGLCWALREDPGLGGSPLDLGRLEETLARFCGTHDFIAFHEKSSPRKPRTLRRAELHRLAGGVLEVRLLGDAFARYMARYLVGCSVAVATGALGAAEVAEALVTGVEPKGLRAPGHGLILWEVRYPPACDAFGASERALAPGLPSTPPFCSPEAVR